MKMLILFKKRRGGVGSAVEDICNGFKKERDIVKTISREDDLKIFSLVKSIFPIRKLIKKLMKEEKYDIIYTQDWSLTFPLLFPSRLFRDKHFSVFYGEDNSKLSIFFQDLIGKKMGARLIVCNDHLKKRFQKSTLIYNRVDINKFKPSKKVKRIKNSVGFANWQTNEYNFNKIKDAVEAIGGKLRVTGKIPKEKMPDFYRKLETFISLPPTYAGFGLVYLEAMASGVPKIIGSNYGGGEILPITKIENFGSIKEAILNAKTTNYREWIIKNNFTWENAVKKLKGIFKDGIKDN